MLISFESALNLLASSSAVIVNGDAVLYPSIEMEGDDLSDGSLFLHWEDHDDGVHYDVQCNKKGNEQGVEFNKSTLKMKTTEGEYVTLLLLSVWEPPSHMLQEVDEIQNEEAKDSFNPDELPSRTEG